MTPRLCNCISKYSNVIRKQRYEYRVAQNKPVRLFTTEQLLCDADNVLFRKVLIDGHCFLYT